MHPVSMIARGAGRAAAATTTTATPSAGRGVGRGAAAPKRGAAAASSGPKVLGAGRDDYECPVCLELCAQPVLTPCKHFMCFQCNK